MNGYLLPEEVRSHALRVDSVAKDLQTAELKQHRAFIARNVQQMDHLAAHVERQTKALEAIAAHFAAPSPVTATDAGDEVRPLPGEHWPTQRSPGEASVLMKNGPITSYPYLAVVIDKAEARGRVEAAKVSSQPAQPASGEVAAERQAAGEVSHSEAREILSRYNASHFRLTDRPHARYSIPANPRYDDDIRLAAYIDQQAARDREAAAELGQKIDEINRLRVLLNEARKAAVAKTAPVGLLKVPGPFPTTSDRNAAIIGPPRDLAHAFTVDEYGPDACNGIPGQDHCGRCDDCAGLALDAIESVRAALAAGAGK